MITFLVLAVAFTALTALTSWLWYAMAVRPLRAEADALRTALRAAGGGHARDSRQGDSAPDQAWLSRQVRLAAEYTEGIAVLLEAAKANGGGIPAPAVRNLAYLKRMLVELAEALVLPTIKATEHSRH